MFPGFPAEALTFLRNLARHNDREWFQARKEIFETKLKAPMTELVEILNGEMLKFAPEHITDPKKAIYRIYRDTRFSNDKSPYKTHIAAVFPTRGLPKHEGAGAYFHVSPDEVWVGGGMYMPQPPQLVAVREHIASHLKQLRAIVESTGFRKHVGTLHGDTLKRVPRGFPADHPAAEYLKFRHFVAGAEFPPAFATSPAFYKTLLTVFRQVTPLTRFLNAPLLKSV